MIPASKMVYSGRMDLADERCLHSEHDDAIRLPRLEPLDVHVDMCTKKTLL